MKSYLCCFVIVLLSFSYQAQTANDYIQKGNEKSNNRDYRGAISDFTKAIELNPQYASVYYFRGIAKVEIDDNNGAISDFSKAIELDSGYLEA